MDESESLNLNADNFRVRYKELIADIEVEVIKPEGLDDCDSDTVKLIHKPTGVVVESSQHKNQITNYKAAILKLDQKLNR